MVNDFHLVHLGKFALGKFGIVFTENCAVEPRGRVTQGDLGLWDDSQIDEPQAVDPTSSRGEGALAGDADHPFRPQGLDAALLRQAGRSSGPKARAGRSGKWSGRPILPAAEGWLMPAAARRPPRSRSLVQKFGAAAKRADAAGYDVLEIHGAHGYLLAQFLSPISNTRNDQYGGDRAGRMRFPLDAARAVRQSWPEHKPLFMRVSAVDGGGGWDVEDTVAFAQELKALGVDVIDCLVRAASPVLSTAAAGQARARLPGAVLFGGEEAGRHPDHGRRPDPRRAAGRGDPAGGRRRPDRDRPPGALRAVLGACTPRRRWAAIRDFEMWTPEYGWWLEKRKNNLVGLKKTRQDTGNAT